MKKEDVPQDLSSLGRVTKEVCYVTDESGKYMTELSQGWNIKTMALDTAWDDIKRRIEVARQKVLSKKASPLLFFMERELMDIEILSSYSHFWKWQIKRHLKPTVFNNLSHKTLERYAKIFNVSVDEFKNMKVHEA